jgi:excisionase family DNA binding protein
VASAVILDNVVVVDGPLAAILSSSTVRRAVEAEFGRMGGAELPAVLLARFDELATVAARWRAATKARSEAVGSPEVPSVVSGVRMGSVEDRMSVSEAATLLGCSARNVRGLCASGTLRARKAGGVWTIEPASVHQLIIDREEVA